MSKPLELLVIRLSAGERNYAVGQVTATDGTDLSADLIELALVPTQPTIEDWHAADVILHPETNVIQGKLLIGGDNGLLPELGDYQLWSRVTDYPTIPVGFCGRVAIR